MEKKKKWTDLRDLTISYSTHPTENSNLIFTENEDEENTDKKNQKVRVQLDTKNRAGKAVSRIFGLEESDTTKEAICKMLKQKCGVGGNVKDGDILIQGDHVQKIITLLIHEGYKNTKRSGG